MWGSGPFDWSMWQQEGEARCWTQGWIMSAARLGPLWTPERIERGEFFFIVSFCRSGARSRPASSANRYSRQRREVSAVHRIGEIWRRARRAARPQRLRTSLHVHSTCRPQTRMSVQAATSPGAWGRLAVPAIELRHPLRYEGGSTAATVGLAGALIGDIHGAPGCALACGVAADRTAVETTL